MLQLANLVDAGKQSYPLDVGPCRLRVRNCWR